MKVRNLLLASVAVVAMTACGNEDEFIDKGNPDVTNEQATMQLFFSFDEKGTTRGATDGGTSAGGELEYGASTITAVLDYGGGKPFVIMKDLTLVKPEGENKIAVASTQPFPVTAGTGVKLYAFINPGNLTITQDTDLDQLAVGSHAAFTAATGTSLAYLDKDVAKNSEFLMAGTKEDIKIEAGNSNNEVKINVSRVAAKLEEKTPETLFPLLESGLTLTGGIQKIGVKILKHSYSNLATNSYVLPKTSTFTDFLQTYVPKGGAATDATYRWSGDAITYCLETPNEANSTRVHYKAQVCFDDVPATETFYIRAIPQVDGTKVLQVYKNWDALKAVYPKLNDTKKDDTDYLKSQSIKKYDGGICYYESPIYTGNSTIISRNNWYQLEVKSVKKLGSPIPAQEPDEAETRLIIRAQIQPWKIQINNIDLQ